RNRQRGLEGIYCLAPTPVDASPPVSTPVPSAAENQRNSGAPAIRIIRVIIRIIRVVSGSVINPWPVFHPGMHARIGPVVFPRIHIAKCAWCAHGRDRYR